MLPRTLSPSGAPISARGLLDGIIAELNQTDKTAVFQENLKAAMGSDSVFLASSGKAALKLVLEALMEISGRRQVVIPAYSSFCLASAVAATGLSVKLCDIDIKTLDLDLEHLTELVDYNTLAVVPVHLFGLVVRFDEIFSIAQAKGAFVVEDAAQAAGARYKDCHVGTIGDAGIFSLGRGKSMSTVQGGVVVAKKGNVADIVREKCAQLPAAGAGDKLKTIISAIAICFLLHPSLYSIPANLPFLKLGVNEYDADFNSFGFTDFQAGIGRTTLLNINAHNQKRVANAEFLTGRLHACSHISLPSVIPASKPCFTRFPLYCVDKGERERCYAELLQAGMGVSMNFPSPLSKIAAFRQWIANATDRFPNAEWVCEHILTLPTHPYVAQRDLSTMVSLLTV